MAQILSTATFAARLGFLHQDLPVFKKAQAVMRLLTSRAGRRPHGIGAPLLSAASAAQALSESMRRPTDTLQPWKRTPAPSPGGLVLPGKPLSKARVGGRVRQPPSTPQRPSPHELQSAALWSLRGPAGGIRSARPSRPPVPSDVRLDLVLKEGIEE